MGKKSKVDRKTKSGRHEEEEEEYSMNAMADDNDYSHELPSNTTSGDVDRVSQDDTHIDIFLDGVENMDNKKTQTRLNALNGLISSLQSGVDLYDRANSNMATLMDNLNRFLTSRSSKKEAILAMKVISILSLVAGAENDGYAEEFSQPLIDLATKSDVEDLDIRVAAVQTLAFVDLVCRGGSGGYATFGVIGDIALLQSEGTDACPELQVNKNEEWGLRIEGLLLFNRHLESSSSLL